MSTSTIIALITTLKNGLGEDTQLFLDVESPKGEGEFSKKKIKRPVYIFAFGEYNSEQVNVSGKFYVCNSSP